MLMVIYFSVFNLTFLKGYRTKNSRNNIFYTSDGSIVFPAGSLGIVQDIQANKQKFFHSKHKEDINAVALHPNGRTVATGDLVTHEDSCFVYLWDSITPQDEPIKIRIGEKKLAKGVADIAFSHDGKYLVVVAMDSDHMVYLYDLQKSTNKPIVSSTGHNDEVINILS
jgi:WD40 repeat protein